MQQIGLFPVPPAGRRRRAPAPTLPPTPAALLRAELGALPGDRHAFMDAADGADSLRRAVEALAPGSVGRLRSYQTRDGWRVALDLCGLRVTGLGPVELDRVCGWLRELRLRPQDEHGMMIGRLAWALRSGGRPS